jgi:hypothetical protein
VGGAPFAITFLLAFALHALFKCMVITEATRRLSEDRQSGALELLLVTPLPPAAIIAGQKAALTWCFRSSKVMLAVMNLLLICLALSTGPMGGSDRLIFVTMFIGGILLLFADCFVIGPVAAWSALTTSRHARAILKTIRIVLLPSWAAILLFWFIGVSSRGLTSETVHAMVVVWIILGLFVDGFVIGLAKARLGAKFRELAATGTTR